MSAESARPPLALLAIAAVYLFSLLLAVSNYGYPFPFMGSCYTGGAADCIVFGDSMISLYFIIGILKRQRLTLWLLIAYNLLDVGNALVNLALLSPAQYASLAEAPIPEGELRLNVMVAALLLMLLNLYVFANRRHFNNRSPYLF